MQLQLTLLELDELLLELELEELDELLLELEELLELDELAIPQS